METLINEVDVDLDGCITLIEFVTLFRNRNKGELIQLPIRKEIIEDNNSNNDLIYTGIQSKKEYFEQVIQFNRFKRTGKVE